MMVNLNFVGRRAALLMVALLGAAGCVTDGLRERAELPFAREGIEWCDVWIPNVGPDFDGKLPRVLLVGDSISRQYRPGVDPVLTGTAYVAGLATSSCVGDPAFRDQLKYILDFTDWDVIHFNNGLHGAVCPDADYERYLGEALDFIHARQPRAKVILALTTFARNGPGVPDRVRARNAAALRQAALRPWIVAVDDLYAVTAADPDAHLNADNVHFNSKGTHELVQAVAKSIRSVLVR